MKKLLLSFVLLLGASVAVADGLYIGGALYTTQVDETLSGVSLDDRDTVPAAFLGYRINSFLAAEVGYYDLGSYSDTWVKLDARAATLAAVGIVPLGLVDLYGKLGLAYIDADVKAFNGLISRSERSAEAFAAAGLNFNILPLVDVFVEYQLFDYDARIDMLGVGVRVAF